MGLLDDAIREHLELRRKHGASDDEIARKETDALGPVRRESLDSPPPAREESWLSGEETMVIAPPSVETSPPPPAAPPVVSEDIYEPQPPPPEPATPPAEPPPLESEPSATGWFDEAGGGAGERFPVDTEGLEDRDPEEPPLAPADVFPEPDPTVPDERLAADPPAPEPGAWPDDGLAFHEEPLEESDPMSALPGDLALPAEEEEPFEEPAGLVEEDPFAPGSEPLAEEQSGRYLEVPEDPGSFGDPGATRVDEPVAPPGDPLAADPGAPLESPPPADVGVAPEGEAAEEDLPVDEVSVPPDGLPIEEDSAVEDMGAAAEPLRPVGESPLEDAGAPLDNLPLEAELPPEEEPLAAAPTLPRDELFEDEAPEAGGLAPLEPEEPGWALEDPEEAAEPELAAPAPIDGDEAPAVQGDDVLEDTPDFLQETPEHDRLWFEQRPPRDFDFDD